MKNSSSYYCLNRFLPSEDGNIAIAFALAAIPAFIIIGAAIDFARTYDTQTRMQSVLDAAVVAAANDYSKRVAANESTSAAAAAAETTLTSFVNAGLANYKMSVSSGTGTNNGSSSGSGSGSGSGSLQSGTVGQVTLSNTSFNTTTNSVSPTMTVNVGTTLLGLAGINQIATTVASSATASKSSAQSVEVSIMVDLTGSMGSTASGDTSSKVANLRLAGQDIINILMPESSDAKAAVAIAPFADYVNAGSYAQTVTNQSATGSYTNIVNLASTKNGAYSGSYSGYYGTSANSQPAGSQAGATTAGTTYSNAYCATPTYQQTSMKSDYAFVWIDSGNGNNTNNGQGNTTTSGDCDASKVGKYRDGWQCQLVTAPVGAPVDKNTPGRVDSNSDGYGGYWMQNGKNNGTYVFKYWDDHRDDNRYYLPVTTTATYSGCEDVAQPSGKLVTCVTERDDANHYGDDEAPNATNGFVGPYNKSTSGTSNKVNYSSDGKCWVAGRELPSVMPLSKDRASRYAFFDGLGQSSVGGGTPGHLGTAWAWYMLSPKWKDVFSSNQPAEYGSARKVVVLMTDGEYNEQYSSQTSKEQALALCTNMKAAGVEVYTVGFGFGQSTTANASGNSSERAMDLLTKCSSGDNHYYFPYNGQKLREAFTAIGNSIVAGSSNQTIPARVTQ